MEENPVCPLNLAHLRMLQASADSGSTCSKTLAEQLNLSRSTVDTYFTHLIEFMAVDSRMGVVWKALDNGWINRLPPP